MSMRVSPGDVLRNQLVTCNCRVGYVGRALTRLLPASGLPANPLLLARRMGFPKNTDFKWC